MVSRYSGAYKDATSLIGLGSIIRIAGVIVAGLIVLGAALSSASQAAFVAGLFLAILVVVSYWIAGALVASQGQILRATVDTAVATSRFLTDDERFVAMGLRE
jgi:uncharacterized membrane protein